MDNTTIDVLDILEYVDSQMVPLLDTEYDVRRTIGGFDYEDIQLAVNSLRENGFRAEIEDNKGNDRWTLVITK